MRAWHAGGQAAFSSMACAGLVTWANCPFSTYVLEGSPDLSLLLVIRVPQKEVGQGSSITFFVFGTVSVTFWSLFLMLLSLFSSLFCQTPFAGLLLRQGDMRVKQSQNRSCLSTNSSWQSLGRYVRLALLLFR